MHLEIVIVENQYLVLENIKLFFIIQVLRLKNNKKKSNGVGENFPTAILAQLNENPLELVKFAQKL